MGHQLAWLLGAAFVASSAFLLITQKGRRNTVLERLHISRRRVSGAKTPPRSLSPGSEKASDAKEVNYVDTLPPSRRFALVATNVPAQYNTTTEKMIESRPNWTQSMTPLERSYLESDDLTYTPCEFSIGEIKALGDFPDYASLSGVPLPNPYPEFDIKTAKPRPYRPFRWAYHQTMCKCVVLCC